MQHAMRVRRRQALGQLQSQPQHFFFRQRTMRQLFRQRHTFDVLHHQEIGFLLAIEVMHRSDVGMIQLGKCQCLFAKSLARFRIGQRARRQDLDGHLALQPLVHRPIDAPHAAGADLLQQGVMPERRANHCPRALAQILLQPAASGSHLWSSA